MKNNISLIVILKVIYENLKLMVQQKFVQNKVLETSNCTGFIEKSNKKQRRD